MDNKFYKNLKKDKIQINWNKNPIKMSDFLSFLTIKVDRKSDHLGHINGWTRLVNEEHRLDIRGGVVNRVEYLDCIQYGTNLQNQHNNYVNVFYIFDILTQEGKLFFFNYYKEDIEKISTDIEFKIKKMENEIEANKALLADITSQIKDLFHR